MPDAPEIPTLRGDRVLLRPWRPADREPFAAMNADDRVMEFFARKLTAAESDAFAGRIEARFAEAGYGLWALEVPGLAEFCGFVGLAPANPAVPCAPAIEVGWRLSPIAWGNGYATEAGRLSLAHGFEVVGLKEIVSFTAVLNKPSQRVMQRLGMKLDGTFDHPLVPAGHPLLPHVLYKIKADEWRAGRAG